MCKVLLLLFLFSVLLFFVENGNSLEILEKILKLIRGTCGKLFENGEKSGMI